MTCISFPTISSSSSVMAHIHIMPMMLDAHASPPVARRGSALNTRAGPFRCAFICRNLHINSTVPTAPLLFIRLTAPNTFCSVVHLYASISVLFFFGAGVHPSTHHHSLFLVRIVVSFALSRASASSTALESLRLTPACASSLSATPASLLRLITHSSALVRFSMLAGPLALMSRTVTQPSISLLMAHHAIASLFSLNNPIAVFAASAASVISSLKIQILLTVGNMSSGPAASSTFVRSV